MIPRFGDSHLEEIRVTKHRVGRGEPAARVTVNPRAVDVDPRIALRELPHSGDLIGKRVVAHFPVVRVVEGFRSPRRSHAVDFDDDESQLGEGLRVSARG